MGVRVKRMDRLDADAPTDPGERAAYWVGLALIESRKAERHARFALALYILAFAMFLVPIIVRLCTP